MRLERGRKYKSRKAQLLMLVLMDGCLSKDANLISRLTSTMSAQQSRFCPPFSPRICFRMSRGQRFFSSGLPWLHPVVLPTAASAEEEGEAEGDDRAEGGVPWGGQPCFCPRAVLLGRYLGESHTEPQGGNDRLMRSPFQLFIGPEVQAGEPRAPLLQVKFNQ